LLIKVDSGAVAKFDAHLRQWNNTFLGVVVEGRTPDVLAEVRAISAASSAINVGVEIMGRKQSEAFGTIGSTNAMNTVTKSCKL
jgi:hypothetical protein